MWKFLVVDDNLANRLFLTEALREIAYCDTAVNGREGFEAYVLARDGKKPYDLILLDIQMPEVDGMTMLGMVRAAEKKAGVAKGDEIPIIMVTAFKEPFMQAFNAGCDDYILKPVDLGQLLFKINMKLKQKKQS